MREVVNAARDQREGVSSGVTFSCRRRKSGEAAENVVGMVWWSAVGSKREEGDIKDGRSRRFWTNPRGGCEVGVTISLVRTRSRGARNSPVRQLAMPTIAKEPKALGEVLRSKPMKPAPPFMLRPAPRPTGSGPVMSGRPTTASSKLRMKLSVVRSRIEYKNVALVARHSPTAPEVL